MGLGDPRGMIEALGRRRSEEHTSELQSRSDLVCRLLLEKKKKISPGPIRSDELDSRLHTPLLFAYPIALGRHHHPRLIYIRQQHRQNPSQKTACALGTQ